MNTIPLSITDSLWVLDGHVDESEPMRHVAISVNPFRIGRSPELALCLQCRSISKFHAEIVLCDDGPSITDLGSKNGTFINGKQITEAEALEDGDLVQFGKVAFRVSQELSERSTSTISVDVSDRALALVQFDTLMSTRAVVPFFQPIVEVQEGQTVGYELLARSNLRGLKNPHVMFLAAARLDLEAELSRLIRSEGIRAGTTLPTAPHLFLNVHPVELTKPGLVRSLREIRDGGSTQSLTVEIHEAAVTNPTKMQHLRDRLRELDVKLAYDDFGAGQARLRVSSPAFSTRTAHTLNSGILEVGSKAGLVNWLVGLSAKWKVMKITPTGETSVNLALAFTAPRRETTRTISPSAMPRFAASTGFISTSSSPRNTLSPLTFLVMVPV